MRPLQRFFGSWRFPALILPLLLAVQLALVVTLLIPADAGALSRFADEMKTWCFGYDPATGKLQLAYVVMFIADPLMLAFVVALVWWRPLRRVARGAPRALLPWASAALVLAACAAGALALASTSGAVDPKEFPAERLRVSLPAPDLLGLVDQDGRPVREDDLRGRIVVVTAVYATCGATCPMILEQARGALAGLTPREQERVTVLAVTLDPERDTPETLARMAEGQQVTAPLFRLLSGPPARVNAALDAIGVTRRRDPETGVIDHANVFLLIDDAGRVAFRFGLGDLQEEWLTKALVLLVDEADARGARPPS